MARFKYKMQNILDVKEKLENKAKQDFTKANAKLDMEKQKLVELQDRRNFYMEEGLKLRLEKIDIRKIRENKMAVLKMDEYIKNQMVQINLASREVEKARQTLQTLMQERKAHEKLKENAFEEFMKEEQAAESKEIDQLTTYTHGQKLMGEQNNG